ncbi:hypothetical protein GCM10009133_14500 [Cocleimonas flava]|uniref:Uncharacterized protein n=1 Tax=Cocleimonas flava TaxID=634765 RepID=A0A4R1F764_9GAMM|nr:MULTISPECIES: hypothetical protein [Cocleimonas]MEB8433071.1 hypothetical protein [Cocleimonas sp. KMM 6892]MEC4715948.1 hypothetical protein [Cocleimonas sp. KMM 6895]MEC4745409.1 hypothetical protein [Cocleimonas sp. KMM 6896]TCJ87818.1 hypothetical protein EV695_2333 [Cocleimonas flava]
MSIKQNNENYGDDYDFENDDIYKESDINASLDDGFDLIFKNSKAINKKQKAKSRKHARRQVEDYMERKAFKEKMKDWDNGFDF